MNNNNAASDNKTLYTSFSGDVTIVRKINDLGRQPKHSYPCVVFELSDRKGTRVRRTKTGFFEYMPTFNELRTMIIGIDPSLEKVLPLTITKKS